MSTRQRHFGADGEIKFVPHRNLYVGFWGGKVVVTKRTSDACAAVLAGTYGVQTSAALVPDSPAKVKTVTKITVGEDLQEFVDRENARSKLWDKNAHQFDLAVAQDRKEIASRIDCGLSPENLTCDGELPASQVRARYRFLSRAGTQLKKLDPSVEIWEL